MARRFVIGDIHGSDKALEEMLDVIFTREKFDAANGDSLLFIGDYVDRGLQSRQVIDRLIQLKVDYPNTIFLRGNHEDMFMAYLGLEGMFGASFIRNGGLATLLSYRTDVVFPTLRELQNLVEPENTKWNTEIAKVRSDELVNLIPESHKDFLKSTQLYLDTPDILFVHAGVNPYATLEQNEALDFIWVRDNRERYFSQISRKPWHKLLIHGHTPVEPNKVKEPLQKNRINVDTGFVYGWRLTCLVVEEGQDPKSWKIIQNDGNKIYWTF